RTDSDRLAHIRRLQETGAAKPELDLFGSKPFTLAFTNMREAAALLNEKAQPSADEIEDYGASLMLTGKGAAPVAPVISTRLNQVTEQAFNIYRDSAGLANSLDAFAEGRSEDARIKQMVRAQAKVTHDITYRGVIGIMGAETENAIQQLAGQTSAGAQAARERLAEAAAQLKIAEKERSTKVEGVA
ncbi:MAG: hypothetical protein EBV03_02355, partial [Proteobacteria bacterium]|nr:hypothetical protein [Pseudomonadota bacterium]